MQNTNVTVILANQINETMSVSLPLSIELESFDFSGFEIKDVKFNGESVLAQIEGIKPLQAHDCYADGHFDAIEKIAQIFDSNNGIDNFVDLKKVVEKIEDFVFCKKNRHLSAESILSFVLKEEVQLLEQKGVDEDEDVDPIDYLDCLILSDKRILHFPKFAKNLLTQIKHKF